MVVAELSLSQKLRQLRVIIGLNQMEDWEERMVEAMTERHWMQIPLTELQVRKINTIYSKYKPYEF